MDHEIEMEVFRAGDYGPRGAYSEEDLERMAADYDPAVHEAPVTVDHQQEGPALGWVRGLRRLGRRLVARLGGLDADFLRKLKEGAFKKRSVELYRRFETTGQPYLRALTFLGAGAPAVKGLADPVFTEAARDAAEAGATSSEAVEPPRETPPLWIAFDETPGGGAVPEPEMSAFCEELRRKGRLLPAWEEKGIGVFLSRLDDAAPLRFGKSSDAPALTLRGWFRDFLAGLDPFVPLGEMTPEAAGGAALAETGEALPRNRRGARLDEHSMALHHRVARYRRERPETSYAEALAAVSSEG